MTNEEALRQLRRKIDWTQRTLASDACRNRTQLSIDEQLFELSIAAIEFVIATEEYEAAQKQV